MVYFAFTWGVTFILVEYFNEDELVVGTEEQVRSEKRKKKDWVIGVKA